MLRQDLTVFFHDIAVLKIINARRMFRFRLVLLKRIFFPNLNEIVLFVRQTGSIIIFLRQEIGMKSRITGNCTVTIPPLRFSSKGIIIPIHIKITIINDTSVLRIHFILPAQHPVGPEHIIHRSFFHPVLNRHHFRPRCQIKKPALHGRILSQMFPAADKDKLYVRGIHALYNPFYDRSAHYPDKRF